MSASANEPGCREAPGLALSWGAVIRGKFFRGCGAVIALAALVFVGLGAGAGAGVGASAAGTRETLEVGAMLPTLAGRNLAGEKVTVHEAAHGRVTLLALGFTYDSRHAVDAWADRFRGEFHADSHVTCLELPMMSGVGARMGKPFIERGMRSGTPKALYGNVIVVWGSVGDWKERLLHAGDGKLAYLMLLDREGRLVWSGTGARDVKGYEKLSARVRALRR